MGRPERDRWMERFLVEEAEAQTRILTGLRGRLERGMDAAEKRDADAIAAGREPSDVPPSREWIRAASLYFDGYRHLAQLQIEHAKLELEARRVTGKAPMSDEEYQEQLRALGRDAVQALPPAERAQTLSSEELEAELARRRALD